MRETHLEGFSLDKYHIESFIGEGGFAEVYRALATDLHIHVAIKVLKPSQAAIPGTVERFAVEARRTAHLQHPNIVMTYAFGECNGWHYIAMKLLQGETLSERIARLGGPLPIGDTTQIVRGVASALDHAHSRGLVHRDVKPQNIYLEDDGSVILTDFGLVREMKGTNVTVTQTIIGTPEYMSPEQVRGVGIGPKSDIYALGHVAYEALTGRAAFPASTGNPFPVLMAHVEEPLPRLVIPGAPSNVVVALDAALRAATAKAPEERFATAGALATALENAAGRASRVQPVVGGTAAGIRPWQWAMLALALLGAGYLARYVIGGASPEPAGASATSGTATAKSFAAERLAPVSATSTAAYALRASEQARDDVGLQLKSVAATSAAGKAVDPTATTPPSPTAKSAAPTLLPTLPPTPVAPPPQPPQPTATPPPAAGGETPQTHGNWPSAEVSERCKRDDVEGNCAHHSRLTFSWSGTLGPDETFQIVAHRTGVEAPDLDTLTAAHCDASIDTSKFCATIPATVPNSNYEWHVRVVRASDGSPRSAFSDTRTQFIDVRFTPRDES